MPVGSVLSYLNFGLVGTRLLSFKFFGWSGWVGYGIIEYRVEFVPGNFTNHPPTQILLGKIFNKSSPKHENKFLEPRFAVKKHFLDGLKILRFLVDRVQNNHNNGPTGSN